MAISRSQMGSQLTGNRTSTGDDAKDLDIIRFGRGGKTKKKSKSRVNEAGNYTQPEKRKRIFNRIKAGGKGGKPGQWSARKAQMLAKAYKKAGGGYRVNGAQEVTEELEVLDKAEVANKVWQAIDAREQGYRRAISS